MPTGYEGWGALGDTLAGGGGTPDVYQDTLKKVYGTEDALQKARRARSQALIDEDRYARRMRVDGAALQELGMTPAAAPVLADILGTGTTMNMRNLGEFSRPGYDIAVDHAQQAMQANDIPAYNRAIALGEGKPYQPVRELGGAYIEDGVSLGDLDMVPTLPTLSQMKQREASGEASLIRANRPPATRSSKPTTASAEAGVLAEARAAIAGGAPAEAVRKRLTERGYSKLAGKL